MILLRLPGRQACVTIIMIILKIPPDNVLLLPSRVPPSVYFIRAVLYTSYCNKPDGDENARACARKQRGMREMHNVERRE